MRVAGSGAVLRRLAGSFSPGTVPVAISTAISGLAVYGFLGVTARVLAPEDYAPLSVLWSLVFILGPGLFVPLEQEVARTVAARAVTGRLAGSALRRAIAIGALASLVIGAAVAALAPVLAVHLFAGRVELAIALSLTVPGMAAVHLTRGVLAGQGRFRGYALLVAAEAVLRFVAAALLAFAGVHAARPACRARRHTVAPGQRGARLPAGRVTGSAAADQRRSARRADPRRLGPT
jgi:O-antigen/teichoic acid export membrane protein